MWLYRTALFFFVTIPCIAQQDTDSLFFVRNASYLYELQPGNYTGPFAGLADSMLQVMHSPYKKYHECTVEQYRADPNGHPADPSLVSRIHLSWDKDLRLYHLGSANADSSSLTDFSVVYLVQMKPLYFVLENKGAKKSVDTMQFIYGKNGLVSSLRQHHIDPKLDTIYVENRLFDGNNRIVVAENSLYGSMRGTFTYEYDKKGNLISRKFYTRSGGALLCSDTLVYSMTDSLGRQMNIRHKLKISGRDEWILIDETTTRRADSRPVEYYLYSALSHPSRFNVLPHQRLVIAYDSAGYKKTGEQRVNLLNGDIESADYVFAHDSDFVTYKTFQKTNAPIEHRLVRKEVSLRNENGAISSKTTTWYTSYYRKKKYIYSIQQQVILKYTWS